MKKHNEGYSLVLVLVVLVLMSLVASFILSVSLKNLQSQTAAVSRMEDKYTAAGEIEKIVAQLEALIGDDSAEPVTLTATPYLADENHWQIDIVGECEPIQIVCTLRLVDATVEIAEGENRYTITGLTKVEYLSYEYLAREVTQDE